MGICCAGITFSLALQVSNRTSTTIKITFLCAYWIYYIMKLNVELIDMCIKVFKMH